MVGWEERWRRRRRKMGTGRRRRMGGNGRERRRGDAIGDGGGVEWSRGGDREVIDGVGEERKGMSRFGPVTVDLWEL